MRMMKIFQKDERRLMKLFLKYGKLVKMGQEGWKPYLWITSLKMWRVSRCR